MNVPLRNSPKLAIVDDSFAEEVSGEGWYLTSGGYVRTTRCCPGRVYLHHLIMGQQDGFQVDHINGDTLDNRTCNLRYVTRSQGQCNRGTPKHNTSGHCGVVRSRNGWGAKISIGRKSHWLGTFTSIEEAIQARRAAVEHHHGEYARRAG